MSAETLLNRLERVKRTGDGRWIACCPAHGDRSPSLAIRETDDGRVLVHCFAGCEPGAIVAAVGLQIRDLFPEKPDRHFHSPIPAADRWNARDILTAAATEAAMAAMYADIAARGYVLPECGLERLRLASTRLDKVARLVAR